MGTGIAIVFAEAGIPVTVVETKDEAVEKARETVFGMFKYQVDKGRLSQEDAWKRANSITFETDFAELDDVDIVVEAAFESMPVKKEIFAKLDARDQARGDPRLEHLDARHRRDRVGDEAPGQGARPALLRAGQHHEAARDRARQGNLAADAHHRHRAGQEAAQGRGRVGQRVRLHRQPHAVRVRSAGGAAGGRGREPGAHRRGDQGEVRLRDGTVRGRRPVGARRLQLHLAVRARQPLGRIPIIAKLVEQGRLGQKSGAGFFKYDKAVGKGRQPIPDPEVEQLIAQLAKDAGIAQNPHVTDEEIIARCTRALADSGAELLRTGVALRPGDVDIVWIYGYGFPPHHGGPMWYAEHEAPFDELRATTQGRNDRHANGNQGVDPCLRRRSSRPRARRSARRSAARSIKPTARRWRATSSRNAIQRAGVDPAEVEDVVVGTGLPEGATGHNIGRVAALRAGLPRARRRHDDQPLLRVGSAGDLDRGAPRDRRRREGDGRRRASSRSRSCRTT